MQVLSPPLGLSIQLLAAFIQIKAKHFIFAHSCDKYGLNQYYTRVQRLKHSAGDQHTCIDGKDN